MNEIEEFARRTHFRPLLISALALSAVVSDRVGDHAKAMSLLAESLSEAEPGSGLRFFLDLGAPVAKLLERLGRERSEWPFLQIVRDGFEAEGSPPTSRKQSQPRAVEETLLDSLTTREREVLDLLAERLRDKEIAERLFVSTDTVNTHLKHIYQKLSVRNRRQAVTRATELGLLEPA